VEHVVPDLGDAGDDALGGEVFGFGDQGAFQLRGLGGLDTQRDFL